MAATTACSASTWTSRLEIGHPYDGRQLRLQAPLDGEARVAEDVFGWGGEAAAV